MTRITNGKVVVFDFDGVICANNDGDYINSPAYTFAINQVNKVYDLGYKVVLFTARYGDRMNGCIARQYNAGYVEWIDWMKENGLKYDEAWMGKPAGMLYVDDKACKVESSKGMEDWDKNFWPALKSLDGKDKYNQIINEPELIQESEKLKGFGL